MLKALKTNTFKKLWGRSHRPLHLKQLVLQALIKRVPKDILEPFVLEKSFLYYLKYLIKGAYPEKNTT